MLNTSFTLLKLQENYRDIIVLGIIIWWASFIGEELCWQPYSTIGLFFSPFILLIGILFWLNKYRSTNGRLPSFVNISRAGSFINGEFHFDLKFVFNNKLKVFTFLQIVFMIFLYSVIFIVRNTDGFKAAKSYCLTNPELNNDSRRILYFGLLIDAHSQYNSIEGEKSNFEFTMVTSKGNFKAFVFLEKKNKVWKVNNLILK